MVEDERDRSPTFTGAAMSRSERIQWSVMLMMHELKDINDSDDFTKITEKHFTWQGTRGGNPIFSKIDRFYANPRVQELGGTSGTWPTLTGISDHASIHCSINKVIWRPKTKATFHKKLLYTQEGRMQLREAWTEGLKEDTEKTWSDKVEGAIRNTMKQSDAQKQRDTKDRKVAYSEQFKNLSAAEIAIQQNWTDEQARRDFSTAQHALHQLGMEQQEKWQTKIDI